MRLKGVAIGLRGVAIGRKAGAWVPCGCASLGVPMSPELGNVRHRTPIAHGLISTERKHPQGTHAPAFLGIGDASLRTIMTGYLLIFRLFGYC
jgi:hypothetical protein